MTLLERKPIKCTSLEYKSKPQVINCLVCDLSFVPESSYPKNIETIYAEVQDPTYLLIKRSRYKTFQESLNTNFTVSA